MNRPSSGAAAFAPGTAKKFVDLRELFCDLVHVDLPPLLGSTRQLMAHPDDGHVLLIIPEELMLDVDFKGSHERPYPLNRSPFGHALTYPERHNRCLESWLNQRGFLLISSICLTALPAVASVVELKNMLLKYEERKKHNAAESRRWIMELLSE